MIFGLVWTAFSSIFVGFGLWASWKAAVTSAWDKVPCVIERFEIADDQKADSPFRADLAFRYEVKGQSYTGTRLWPDKKASDDYEDLAEIRESFAQGPEGRLASIQGVAAECRVNPSDPAESALMAQSKGGIFGGLAFAIFGGFFVLIGIALIVGGFRGTEAKQARSSKDKQAAPWILVIFFLFFGCAGLAVLCGFVIPRALDWIHMRGWRETPAEIIWSRVSAHDGDDSTTYSVDLFYRYQVDGRDYRSNRYDVAGGSSSGRSGKQAVVSKHPPGSKLTVFVDPDKPWRAVVKRDLGWSALFALFPLPFLAVGFGGVWWTLKKRREARSVSAAEITKPARQTGFGATPMLKAGEWIPMGRSYVGAYIFLVFFTLLWNGIVWFAIRDSHSPLGGLFKVPFYLAGVGLVIALIIATIALFRPTYEFQIGKSVLGRGESTQVKWRRRGGKGQPRSFKLFLVGKEEATYSAGSSNSTAKACFHEDKLFETTVPLAMNEGHVEFRIPADAVPTFTGKNNKLRWLLCLRAEVARMPTVSAENEIIVQTPAAENLR